MKIAITGTIASGKSLVCEYLRNKGYKVIDCDQINAYLLQKDNLGYKAIIKEFDVLDQDLNIDKKRLADIVFNDKKQIDKLNRIMHPLIKEELINYLNRTELAIVEVPLLFEISWQDLFDKTLLVCASEDIIKKRLVLKGYSEAQAIARINNQMSVSDKIKLADDVIYNNGDIYELSQNIEKWWKKIND